MTPVARTPSGAVAAGEMRALACPGFSLEAIGERERRLLLLSGGLTTARRLTCKRKIVKNARFLSEVFLPQP
jgi:hypothetical protein